MKKNNLYILSLALFLATMCGSFISTSQNERNITPSYANGSGYIWETQKAEKKIIDSIWVNLSVHDNMGNLLTYGTTISSLCQKLQVDNGKAAIKLKRSDIKRHFRAVSIGYFTVETEPCFFSENDSVIIDFVLAEDDRPLINCE
jgi:hypothetical protein